MKYPNMAIAMLAALLLPAASHAHSATMMPQVQRRQAED